MELTGLNTVDRPAAAFTLAEVRGAFLAGLTVAIEESELDADDERFTTALRATLTLLSSPSATPDTRAYTRAQVAEAVNAGVDTAAAATGRGVGDDLDSFLVNAVMTLLENPKAGFTDIAEANYGSTNVRTWS